MSNAKVYMPLVRTYADLVIKGERTLDSITLPGYREAVEEELVRRGYDLSQFTGSGSSTASQEATSTSSATSTDNTTAGASSTSTTTATSDAKGTNVSS